MLGKCNIKMSCGFSQKRRDLYLVRHILLRRNYYLTAKVIQFFYPCKCIGNQKESKC